MLSSCRQNPRKIVVAGLLIVGLYTVGVLELGVELGLARGRAESAEASSRGARRLRDCGGHPRRMYGHVHVAKTGGTSVNGILAGRFERVCGNKANSYDAYRANVLAGERAAPGGAAIGAEGVRGKRRGALMDATGYEDCDYVSQEDRHGWWVKNFADGGFHGVEMELHVPCRDPIDHLMSQCNFWSSPPHNHAPKRLACHATTDAHFFRTIERCLVGVRTRFDRELEERFDVKCYDYEQQYTTYIDVMGEFLEDRRVVADRYVKRETNAPRNKEAECIWERPDLMEKARDYLVKNVDYYGFCDKCMGTENDLTLGGWKDTSSGIVSK